MLLYMDQLYEQGRGYRIFNLLWPHLSIYQLELLTTSPMFLDYKITKLSGFDEGPPPYFPPDNKTPPGMSFSATPEVNNVNNSTAPQNDLNNPSGGEPPKASNIANDAGSSSGGLDLPELPGVPVGTPVHERSSSPPDTKKDDEEDIDFDDLTRRFEALKKKK